MLRGKFSLKMWISKIDIKKTLFLLMSVLLISAVKGEISFKGPCKDRWRKNCKHFAAHCHITLHWARRYCPKTCGVCQPVDPCRIQKCQYHSKCSVIGNVVKCQCRNLRDCAMTTKSFVCGSDGVTYKNVCHLEAISCRLKLNIDVSHVGFCELSCSNIKCNTFGKCVKKNGSPRCTCPTFNDCPKIPRPICGANGITYYNRCLWKVMSCRAKAKILIQKNGRCVKRRKTGTIKGIAEPKVFSCKTRSCPYYTLCQEIDGYPACVKICPYVKCHCQHGTSEKYYQLNGCKVCSCEKTNV